MDIEVTTAFLSQAIWLIVVLICLIISPGLLLGVFIAIIQAVTQINEQTLSFLPKLLTTLIIILIFGSWIITELTDFFNEIFYLINDIKT